MAYFLLTLLVTAAITFWIPVVGWFTVFALYPGMILLPIGGHFLMKKYAYAITQTDWPKKPRSRLGLYLPVVFPMMWYLFWTAQGNLSGALHVSGGPSDLLFAFFSVHSYGMFAGTILRPLGLEEWHAVLIMNLLYDGIIIWGFARGERLSAQKLAVKPIPLFHHKKFIAVFLAVVISAYAYSEYVLYDQRRNIVSSASHPSYNFKFENGYFRDGIYPDEETIRSGEYPYTTELYAITVAGRTDAKKDTIEAFLAWMIGPQGQQIVADTGYVAVE